MSKLKVSKNYNKFTEEIEYYFFEAWTFKLSYKSSPSGESLSLEEGIISSGVGRILLLNGVRRIRLGRITKEDLREISDASSIEYEFSDSAIFTEKQNKLRTQSLRPMARLMYNTVYSSGYYDESEIQKEWRKNYGRLDFAMTIKDWFGL